MSYEYMSGMGTTAPAAQQQRALQEAMLEQQVRLAEIEGGTDELARLREQSRRPEVRPSSYMVPTSSGLTPPIAPPGPTYPRAWRGNYEDCKLRGGTLSSSSSSSIWADIAGTLRTGLAVQPTVGAALQGMHGLGSPALLPPGGFTFDPGVPRVSVTRCYNTGSYRDRKRCCYPQVYIDQKQAEAQAQMEAYQAQLEAYKETPAYLKYQEDLEEYRFQRMADQQKAMREQYLLRYPATAEVGDECSPPEGGIVGKFYAPIPATQEERDSLERAGFRLRGDGCEISRNFFDIDNMEVCCPPGVVVPGVPVVEEPPVELPPIEPPVTNGNGNGNGAQITNGNGAAAVTAADEKKYFGFTTTQLAIGAVGAGALYMLLKK